MKYMWRNVIDWSVGYCINGIRGWLQLPIRKHLGICHFFWMCTRWILAKLRPIGNHCFGWFDHLNSAGYDNHNVLIAHWLPLPNETDYQENLS